MPAAEAVTPLAPPVLLTETARQGQQMYASSLNALGQEYAVFFSGLLRDDIEAFQQLCACKSPLEALAAGEAWWMARTKACMDAGLRIFEACLPAGAASATATPGTFHLPE